MEWVNDQPMRSFEMLHEMGLLRFPCGNSPRSVSSQSATGRGTATYSKLKIKRTKILNVDASFLFSYYSLSRRSLLFLLKSTAEKMGFLHWPYVEGLSAWGEMTSSTRYVSHPQKFECFAKALAQVL